MFKTFFLYWHTLRFLRASQLFWRIFYSVRHQCRLYRVPRISDPPPSFNPEALRRLSEFLEHCNRFKLHGMADINALRDQSFCFLNRPAENTGEIPWRDRHYPKLWLYQLHSFSYGRDFAINAAGDDYLGDRDRALGWIRDWIDKNPPGASPAWDAGPVSDRLLNWALLTAAFKLNDAVVRGSYYCQVKWLEHWLEYDLRANHLLKNACALTLAGEVLNNQHTLDRGMRLLEEQIKEQFLPDGGHFERSPMYHLQALWDALLVYAVLEEKPEFLKSALADMTSFLEAILHPDGNIPLFGDSVLRAGPPTQALLRLARHTLSISSAAFPGNKAGHALKSSGFYVLGDPDKKHCMIVKTAPPSPPYQPGHSHADLFSYELSLAGQRFIVDSGVHGYAESPFRGYCRSTRAHNTAQLDDLEQCEAWHTFRIARRPHAVSARFNENDKSGTLDASFEHHTGYQHHRVIHFNRNECAWEIQDTVQAPPGEHELKSYIHFHPAWEITLRDNNITASLGPLLGNVVILPSEPHKTEYELDKTSCRYYPELGVAIPSSTVIIRSFGHSPLHIAYRISVL